MALNCSTSSTGHKRKTIGFPCANHCEGQLLTPKTLPHILLCLHCRYRPKITEHVIAGYLRKIWDKDDWLYEGQHGFIPGYCCENHVCRDIADSLDERDGIDAIITDFARLSI